MHTRPDPDRFKARLLRMVFSVIGLTLLAGCGTPTMKPAQAAAIQRVGIVSLLPSELRYEKVGVTVFNNEKTTRPVGDALNSVARAAAERSLNAASRQAVQLTVDVPTLAKRLRSAVITFDSPAEQIKDELSELARANKLDAIVLIAESFDAENGIQGIRMYLRAGLGDIRLAAADGDLMTLVVDANVKKLAGQYRGTSLAIERPQGQPWSYALQENLDAPTEEHVNAQILRIVDFVVSQHIRTMGF